MQPQPAHAEGVMDLSAARHVAAHVVAHLHFGLRFESAGLTESGSCEIVGPDWGTDLAVVARIALAGPCMDLVVDLIEDQGEYSPTPGWLETWRDDVVNAEGFYHDDMIAARGGAANETAVTVAFCRVNFDLIDEAAIILLQSGAPVGHAAFESRLQGRTIDVNPVAVDAAEFDLMSGWIALENIDAAVIEYLANDMGE
jgi:hypothetical protein